MLLHPNPSQFQVLKRKMTRPEEEATRGDIIHISLSGGGISPAGLPTIRIECLLLVPASHGRPVVYPKVEGRKRSEFKYEPICKQPQRVMISAKNWDFIPARYRFTLGKEML